jgi:plastocyanin
VAVRIAGFKFAPVELTVSVGDTVVWTNDDALMHTTAADSGAWSSPEMGQGERFRFVTVRTGRFPYHCAAHPVMRATLVVRP